MSWYYAQNNEKVGPINQSDFDRLLHQGVITSSTLVWREGMPTWQAQGELSHRVRPAAAAVTGGDVRCVQCGEFFSQDQVIRFNAGAPADSTSSPLY